MSKKNLLTESQVRQFMKLASLEPLARGFVEGLSPANTDTELDEVRNGTPPPGLSSARRGHGRGTEATDRLEEEEEDHLEREFHATEDELGAEDHLADEEGAELGDEALPAPEPEGDERMISVTDLLSALESTLETFLDTEVEMDYDAEDLEAEEEVEIDTELPIDDVEVDLEAELEEAVTKGSDAEEDESLGMEDGKKADKDMSEKGRRKVARADARKDESAVATDELVEQITKRVAARILKTALTKK